MVEKKEIRSQKRKDYPSYRTRLFIVITSIFFAFILIISCLTYFYTINQVMTEFNNTRMQAEKTFISSAILTEYGIESFDARYDFLLNDRIFSFLRAYQDNRLDPGTIDLQALKEKMSAGVEGDIELFIINREGVVEFTTYKRDENLDFSNFPDFFSSLTAIREGNEFRSDPWIRDFYNPQIYWKYGYLPTDDHEYILEIGLRNKNYSQLHKEMISELRDVSGDAMNIPGLIHVEVFDKAHRKQTIWSEYENKNLSSVTSLLHKDELENLLNQTFDSKEFTLINNPEKNQIISVQYINLSSTRSASGAERSYVGILVFSTENINQIIFWYQTGFILVTLISLIMGLIIAQYLSAYISRPIEMMTEDVGIIAGSSLNHSVRATGIYETEILRTSINQMVASIKDYITEVEHQEEELRIELTLREKAELSLARANKRLTQLSQITRHDVLNQITAIKIYLELIPETPDKSVVDEYAEHAHAVLKKIILLLSFTSDYEQIGQEGPVWINIGKLLDQNKNAISERISIIHTCDSLEILADPLINKVFYNLIDNSIRHGEKADTIRIFFEESPESGCLVYEDNGIGIVEKFKERIFNHGFGKGTGLGMAFIREVLESNDILIAEKGVEGQGVRFEIIIPKGQYRIVQKDKNNI